MTLIFLLLIVSCTPSASAVQRAIDQTQAIKAQIETAIAQTQAGNASLLQEEALILTPTVASYSSTPDASFTPEANSTPRPTNTPSFKRITTQDTITLQHCCRLFIDKVYFGNKILPPNTSGYYSYYETKSNDSTYLDIVLNITNLESSNKSAEDFASVSAIYDNQYTYDSFPILVDRDGDFTMAFYAIEPLLSEEVHFLIEVPNQVESSSKPLVIVIKVGDQEYHYQYR